MGAGKNFLNWLQGTFGGNNDSPLPDFPLPVGVEAPKSLENKPVKVNHATKKSVAKKATPAKKAAPKKATPKKKVQ